MCTIGGHQLSDHEVHKTCCRARRMAADAGRGAYVVLDNEGYLHSFLSLHKPTWKVLAIVSVEIVWMVDTVWVA